MASATLRATRCHPSSQPQKQTKGEKISLKRFDHIKDVRRKKQWPCSNPVLTWPTVRQSNYNKGTEDVRLMVWCGEVIMEQEKPCTVKNEPFKKKYKLASLPSVSNNEWHQEESHWDHTSAQDRGNSNRMKFTKYNDRNLIFGFDALYFKWRNTRWMWWFFSSEVALIGSAGEWFIALCLRVHCHVSFTCS